MPEADKPLIDLALECDERLVRAEAVESLGARDPERVVGVLVYVAKNDPDEMVRREAVETLGDLRGDDGLKALRVLQKSSDPAVRSEVAETLHDMAERAQRR
jgi:HEAT repeat protein